MKKILILIPDLRLPGGVTNYYKTLKLDAEKNITYFPITSSGPQSAIATSFRLLINYCKFLYTVVINRYDVVLVNPSLDMGRSYHRDLIFIAIARILSMKTIVFFRGWFDAYEQKIKQSKWKKFLFKISYAKASKYIVLGNIFRKKLIELGVPDKAEFFIETTVADSQYLKDFQLSKKFDAFKEEIRILLLARISIEKGIYIAIDAYKGLSERYPEKRTSLIIAGEGPDLPALKKYVEELKIPGIKFMGHVDLDKKGKVLLESHVMILPSISGDGLPNSILEGMLYGMPIISRTTAGIPDVIQQDVNGYLSESLEPTVFTDFMSLIVNNSELYKKISENNHNTAIDKFTSEKVRERMIKIFQTYN